MQIYSNILKNMVEYKKSIKEVANVSNIGQNIKNRRLELGLTADQLANRLQKSRATI